MSKANNNSLNGSNSDSEVYVVDFKKKQVTAVFIDESDRVVLGYLAKIGQSPIKIINKKLSSCSDENVLRFHPKAA